MFISQPALTKQINLLESLVETSLFTRGASWSHTHERWQMSAARG
ncbi:LysR family transcriptional regulator [Pantoea agglomerans]|nr:LysR family transcriptional regulator [Pantoea agglomerans]